MFPYQKQPQDDADVRLLTDEDQQVLLRLVQRYGLPSLLCALTAPPASSGDSTFSSSTLFSSISNPSLARTGSDASYCKSDDASIHTQFTWAEMSHDTEPNKIITERSWLDPSAAEPSPLPRRDITLDPSPRFVAPTSKKYQCPMCFLDNSPVGFGRKSDFKKHLHNFHGADMVWICHTKGCHLTFSTERAYSAHAKEAHRKKALPNSMAQTELCAQLVFSCGFATCKERLFEAQSAEGGPAIRYKHFEHIAKHFEEGFNVKDWEYRIQIQNLMRQPQVKPVWKTCIWPKEKRLQLYWRPRSSGELKRMLECRHLGNDISNIVRLAFILGTAPFTNASTPPPGEIDIYFQLPHRNTCLIKSADHNARATESSKADDEMSSTSTLTSPRSRSSIATTVFRLPNRQGKRSFRHATFTSEIGPSIAPTSDPTNASTANPASNRGDNSSPVDTVMRNDNPCGPHPGTPFPIPSETVWPVDAPKFAPEASRGLSKQMNATEGGPMIYAMQMEQSPHESDYSMESFDPYAHQVDVSHSLYNYNRNANQMPMARPAAPIAHKRPASWSRVVSTESFWPAKKSAPHANPILQEMAPTMLSM